MIRLFKKIQSAVKNRKTYNAGLIQAKVYRILKDYTQSRLKAYDISTVEWALLGLLYEHTEGLRSGVIAQELGVESPFVTVLLTHLKKIHVVDFHADAYDSRVKINHLTEYGKEFVIKIEKFLREEMKPLLAGINHQEILAYISVLEQIAENSQLLD